MTNEIKYVVNQNNIKDILTFSKMSKTDFQKLTSSVLSDVYNPVYEKVSLSEYSWKFSYLCSSIQMSIMQCVEKLKKHKFNNFTIDVIYVSQERKEILSIVNKVNDDVLDEYYTVTYDELKPVCPECVFMIAECDDIDFSIMPKFDKIIEV